MPGGRPPKFTDVVVGKLEEVFALDGTIEEACFYAGIHRDTYYENIKKQPKLADRFEALRLTPVLKARTTVVAGIGSNYGNAMDYLARKRKHEFAPRQEVTGANGEALFNDETKHKANSAIDALIEGDAEQGK